MLRWDSMRQLQGTQKIHTEFLWVRQSYPITGLNRTLGHQEVQAPRIPRQLAHEDDKIFSPQHRPYLTPPPLQGVLLVLVVLISVRA
jgi:hypothetical protein